MQQLLDKLSAPFPPEAHEIDDSRGFTLVGIKGAYVVERLNEVFGPCGVGWTFKTTNADVDDKWVVVNLELTYRLNGNWSEPVSVIGSSNIVKGRVGDAKKGAIQDGIKKAASYLGIGQEAYKGLLKADTQGPPRKPRPQRPPTKKAKLPEPRGEGPSAEKEERDKEAKEPVREGKSKWYNCVNTINRARDEIPYYEHNAPHIIATLSKLEKEGIITWDKTSVDDVFDALNKYASQRANEKAAKE